MGADQTQRLDGPASQAGNPFPSGNFHISGVIGENEKWEQERKTRRA